MDEDLFSDPLNKIVSYVRSLDQGGANNNNDHGMISTTASQDLAQYLWSQKTNFTDRLCKLKEKGNGSDTRRADIRARKQFSMRGDMIEVSDDFIQIAFQLSDNINIDEYLACQILAHVLNITSIRDNSQLLSLCEDYGYQTRSCYIDALREILNYLNSDIDKVKRDILQMFICELLTPLQECLVSLLLKLLDEKIRNITVPTNQKEFKYRLQECQKIVECLFLICFQFTIKPDLIKSILIKLRECSKLFSNQQPDSFLYHQLFQVSFSLLMTIFVLLEDPKVLLMNPSEKKPTTNNCLGDESFLKSILHEIKNEWEHNIPIQSTLITLYHTVGIKNSSSVVGVENHLIDAFPKDRNGIEFLAKMVDSKEFKQSTLKSLYQFVLDNYACTIIQYFPINDKNNYISFLNNFNQYLVGIYKESQQNSKRFWEFCENSGYLKTLWFQIPNGLIVSSFHMMAALTVNNGIEVYNFFTKDSSQFTWNKIIQLLQLYVDALNQPNTEISPTDTDALNAFLCLVTETINYAPQLAQMLARNVPLILLFFRFVTSPVSVAFKSTTLKAIAACARYPAYVPDIWKLLIESKIFPSGLRLESQSSEHGEFPFTQQFLELFYQLLQVSPFLFDRSNDATLRQYLDHIMELFQSFNNKAFNHILDKWRFTLTILNIFMYCLSQFKASVVNHVIDRRHPVYPLYAEVTKMSHHHTLQTIIGIVETAAAASDSPDTVASDSIANDLFQDTLSRCLEIILFVSDSSVFAVDDARSIVTQLSSVSAAASPIVAIAKLVDHANPDIGLKALRLIYSFEVYTQRISSLFLSSQAPDALLERFVRVMECTEHEHELSMSLSSTSSLSMAHTPYLVQEDQFQRYAKQSIQWTVAQLILYCLDKSAGNAQKYTLGHFLLGCPSIYDLSVDFEKHSRTCLTVLLRKVADVDFVTRFPHLNDCYHQIIHRMVAAPVTTKPMIDFLPLSYYRDNVLLLKSRMTACRNERVKDAHVSALSWLLKTMATALHCGSDPLIKNYFMSLLVGGDGRGGLDNNLNNQLEILHIFNAFEFEFNDLQKPRIFEMIPALEASCLTNYRDCQIINLALVRKHLETDGRFTTTQEIDREIESCAKLNIIITLLDSKTRALEGWKLFLNESLLQIDTLISMNEMIPLTLLQRIVVEFANEKYPVTCGISLGYTILTLLYVLKVKKDTYQLMSNFNDILESKVKGIFEGLIQTVLKSPYQPIRGIAYTCIIKYLQLTHSFNHKPIDGNDNDLMSSKSNTMMNMMNVKSIEKHNIGLLNKVDDRLLRSLLSDCHSFNGGWKIAATSCLELLVSLDVLRGNRTLKAMDDRSVVNSIISQCVNVLQKWEKIDARDLRVYDSQMSLLCRVAQNIDGVRILMSSNVVAAFSSVSFLTHVPSDLTSSSSSSFASLIIPLLRLLASLFHFQHERIDVYTNVQSLISEHSDLFKFILQDAHQPSSTSLTILQLTVHLFAQTSKLQSQHQQSSSSDKSQSYFNRFHYSILSLFTKYSRTLKSSVKEDRDDCDDEDRVKIDFTNQKDQQSLFQVEMNHFISLICRDIILYCRRVSIIQNIKFGSVCFGSNIKTTMVNGNQNHSILPSLDVANKYLKECLVSYNQSLEIIEYLKQSIDNVDTLTPYQLKQILNDDHLYQDLEVSARNQLVIKKLGERLIFRYLHSDLLKESIETILLVIVTHVYYYTVSVQSLFAYNNNINNSMISTTTPSKQSIMSSTTSPQLMSSNYNNNGCGLDLSDLNTPTRNNRDIFLHNDQQQQPTPNKLMSSMFSYLRGMTSSSVASPISNAPIISTTATPTQPNASLLRSMVQQQQSLQQQGELSPQDAQDFLAKVWSNFEMEVPMVRQRLFDCIQSMPKKTLIVDLLIKKLQDLFNKN